MRTCFSLILLIVTLSINAQEAMKKDVPYATIPDAPTEYTATAVTSRMIDGLGFRFYWATEGLSDEDLRYKPSGDGRTIEETIDHVHGLSMIILNAALKVSNDRTVEQVKPSKEDLRSVTLANLKMASDLIKNSEDLSEHKIIFVNKKGTSEFPFWNVVNGPIEDAVWHSGQIVMMRRAAGNPFNLKANVFTGQVRE